MLPIATAVGKKPAQVFSIRLYEIERAELAELRALIGQQRLALDLHEDFAAETGEVSSSRAVVFAIKATLARLRAEVALEERGAR